MMAAESRLYIESSSAGVPLLGTEVTATLCTVMLENSLTAPDTASPIPPTKYKSRDYY